MTRPTLIPPRLCALLSTSLLASCSILFQESASDPEGQQDAATADAPPGHLLPSFTVLPLGCGETLVEPTNVSVTQGDGQSAVALYRWVLSDPVGNEVFNILAPPDEVLERGARIIGGTVAAPEFNLTLYRGKQMALFTRLAGAEVPSLLQDFPLSAGDYELEVVFVIPNGAMESHLRNSAGVSFNTNVVYDCVMDDTCGALQYKLVRFSTNGQLTGTDATGMLQFIFYGVGAFYLDGIRLRYLSNGSDLVDNGSFRDVTNWSVGNGSTGSVQAVPIPPVLTAYGDYTLTLNGVDAVGTEGPSVSQTISHTGCQ
jgi:hypothetical protein